MKTEPQRNAELTQLCELIEDMSVAMLTNLDDKGAMVSRPRTRNGAGAVSVSAVPS